MENTPRIELHQQRDFSNKINTTFQFIKDNFKTLAKSLLYIAGPPALLGGIFVSGFYRRVINASLIAQQDPGVFSNVFGNKGFWLELIAGILFMFCAGISVISVVNNYLVEYETASGRPIEVSDIWKRVTDTFLLYLGTFLLYTLLLAGGYLLLFTVIALVAQTSPGIAVLLFIGAFAGLTWLGINLSLLFFIRGYERKGFFESIGRCFFLVRGKWWSTFAIIFIAGLIQSMIASFFFIPWYINFIVQAMHSLETTNLHEPSLFSRIIDGTFLIIYFLGNVLLYVIPLTALGLQYFNLVELKEATGLMGKIDQIGRTGPASRKDEDY